MHLEHAALWTCRLEELKSFYERFFGARANDLYVNSGKGFSSYFLSFGSGARLELMQRRDVTDLGERPEVAGYAHLAFQVGSEAEVLALTERLRAAGVPVLGEPRRTGDGYFESVVADPDGNRIELTAMNLG